MRMDDLKELSRRRDVVEAEINSLVSFLQEQGFGVQGKLVDEEGFPIGDVAKIISVREARNKLARLQTDYRELMKNIESGLSQLHQNSANKQRSDVVGRPSPPATSSDSVRESFAEVDEVLEGSPAEEAQLRVKDEIVFWGSVNKDSVNRFQAIAELTTTSEGRPISVGVVRSGSVHMLVLVPKKWRGRGLLGCHLIPRDKN